MKIFVSIEGLKSPTHLSHYYNPSGTVGYSLTCFRILTAGANAIPQVRTLPCPPCPVRRPLSTFGERPANVPHLSHLFFRVGYLVGYRFERRKPDWYRDIDQPGSERGSNDGDARYPDITTVRGRRTGQSGRTHPISGEMIPPISSWPSIRL